MTGRLLLARHGHTSWNGVRLQGWEDVPLDDEGLRQAETLADTLRGERVDVVLSSPLVRAVATVRRVAGDHGVALEEDPDLRELHYGSFQGAAKDTARLAVWRKHLTEPVPGGESISDLVARARRVAARVVAHAAEGRTVLVGGHRGVNRALLGVLAGRTVEEVAAYRGYKPPNGSVLDVRLDVADGGSPTVVSARYLVPIGEPFPAEGAA